MSRRKRRERRRSPGDGAADPRAELRRVIRGVRRRWRLRLLLRGLALVLGAGFVLYLSSAFGIERLRFAPAAVTAFRAVLYVAVGAFAALFVVRPLVRRVPDERVALYLEEHEPSLGAAVLSAVERTGEGPEGSWGAGGGGAATRRRGPASSDLTERLIRVAAERARRVDGGRAVERARIRRAAGALGGVVAVVALTALLGPGFQATAGPLLLAPWRAAAAANPYALLVEPGNVRVPRGSDLKVRAVLRGFETEEAEIAVRRRAAQTWERQPMVGAEDGAFEILLFDLDAPLEYVVEAAGVRSEAFRIEVADLPYVDRIDLEYRFPAYTGLPPRTVEDGGDIAALRGTEVVLRIVPTIPVPAGRLVVEGAEEPVPLVAEGEGFRAAIAVDRETFYRIELEGPDGEPVRASPDFRVEPLDDQPPGVAVAEPGRDRRATSIEEVYLEVEAEDDHGIGRLDLRVAVNGGEERTISLHRTERGGATALSRGHTLFLEELGLEPGDLISYYARATDLAPGGGSRSTASDIYFIEIRPFDRAFRQADQSGAPGGGGADMEGQLSERQRQIVAATFRVDRDASAMPADERAENLATLTLLQGRLRERVDELVARTRTRGVTLDSAFLTVFEELPRAAEAMRAAEERLGQRRPGEALPPERRALRHLQRAEAAFRDVQVARGGPQGGGGGGGPAAEDLADLFELELDRERNQYEGVERGERRERDERVDEALQRLEELARRQQQMNERTRAGPAADGGRGQRRLGDETERLARELERLSREDRRPELRETARRLREAADAMRRSSARGEGGAARGEAALDRLRDARRLLESRRAAALEREVDDALRRSERLVEEQREMAEDVERLGGSADPDRLRRLRERKDAMAGEVEELETDLDRLARESRRERPEVSRSLERAANSVRENQLRERILYSRGVVGSRSPDYARNFEEDITRAAEELRDRVAEARDAFAESDPRPLERQLEEARDLVRGLESLEERIRQATEEGSGSERDAARGRDEEAGRGAEEAGGEGEGGARGGGRGEGGSRTAGDGGRADAAVAPGGGGAGGLGAEDVRQLRREFGQRREDAQRLREELRREGADVGELSSVIERLRALERDAIYDDPDELERLQAAALTGLRDFEFALRRALEGEVERLFLSPSDEVPPEYRALVEEYYRALSEGGPP